MTRDPAQRWSIAAGPGVPGGRSRPATPRRRRSRRRSRLRSGGVPATRPSALRRRRRPRCSRSPTSGSPARGTAARSAPAARRARPQRRAARRTDAGGAAAGCSRPAPRRPRAGRRGRRVRGRPARRPTTRRPGSATPPSGSAPRPPRRPTSPPPAGMESFIETYIATAVTDPAAAFEMLTPPFQEQSNGIDGYIGFWGEVKNVRARRGLGRPGDARGQLHLPLPARLGTARDRRRHPPADLRGRHLPDRRRALTCSFTPRGEVVDARSPTGRA